MRDERENVWCGKLDWIAPPSKQLITDLIAANIDLYVKKQTSCINHFRVIGSNSNLNGADDQTIQLETDNEMIFKDEHDGEVFMAL